jgi:hypothetical protein
MRTRSTAYHLAKAKSLRSQNAIIEKSIKLQKQKSSQLQNVSDSKNNKETK